MSRRSRIASALRNLAGPPEEPTCHCGFWNRMSHPGGTCPTCGGECRCFCHAEAAAARITADNARSRRHHEVSSRGLSDWTCIPLHDAVEVREALRRLDRAGDARARLILWLNGHQQHRLSYLGPDDGDSAVGMAGHGPEVLCEDCNLTAPPEVWDDVIEAAPIPSCSEAGCPYIAPHYHGETLDGERIMWTFEGWGGTRFAFEPFDGTHPPVELAPGIWSDKDPLA